MNLLLVNAESELRPLCRSYVCALFEALKFQVKTGASVRAMQLCWAVGVLSDHTPEFLGSWHLQDAKDAHWRAIADDLQDRGVERLRFAIGPDPVEIQAAMAPHYRDNAALPTSAALAHHEVESTLHGHLPYLERALDVANALSPRLKRIAARNGPVANGAAAAALLRTSAEGCIAREWPDQYDSSCEIPSRRSMVLPVAFA